MAAKAKKQVKSSAKKQAKAPAKKKEVKSSRRKTHQAGRVAKDAPEMKGQRKQVDSKKTGVRKTRKQRDVKNQGTPSRSVSKSPRRAAAKKSVRRARKPSSATMTPAPADAGMPAELPPTDRQV
jgi:hypothetical protein